MKVFLDSVGCRLNQSEIERIALQFRAAGHEIVDSPSGADYVVVNTCSVTTQAASDSRQKIRQAHRAGQAEIIATGCWATLDPKGAAALPGVQRVVNNQDKEDLVPKVLQIRPEEMDLEPLVREPLPGIHLRTRAFIKVQDGCDNFCTFCVTRLARGVSRSISVENVLQDIRRALLGGARELVLTGVHLGSWGQDFEDPLTLRHLLEAILKEPEIFRLRLSSLEPWDLDESFFSLWNDRRLCRHLHLPLQSGAEATLRRMARKVTPDSFANLVGAARSAIPDLAVTTDVIAGFPGETDSDFAESLAFVQSMRFAGGHVFTFSPRPGTAAARYLDQIPTAVRKERNAQLRSVLSESAVSFRQKFVGQTVPVLWESSRGLSKEGWRMEGLTDNYLRVRARSPEIKWNEISPVLIQAASADGLLGQIVSQT